MGELGKPIRPPFEKDRGYCTLAPDLNFSEACWSHDAEYGDPTSTDRAGADRRLRQAIAAKGWHVVPWLYWIGVRLFGWYFWHRDTPITALVDRVVGIPYRAVRRLLKGPRP